MKKFKFGLLLALLFGASAMIAQTHITTFSEPYIDDVTQQCGVFNIDIEAEKYFNVGAISYTINYDHTKITRPIVIGTNPSGWVDDYSEFMPFEGQIHIGWNGTAFMTPVSGKHALFTLQFETLVDDATESVWLTWPNTTPEENELAGPNGSPIYADDFTDKLLDFVFTDELVIDNVDVVCFQCPSSPTGAITVDVIGGQPSYWYAWNGPGITPPGENSPSISGLVAGTYQVVVTDEYYCSVTMDIIVPFCDVNSPTVPANILETVGCIDEAVDPTGDYHYFGYPHGNYIPPRAQDACGGLITDWTLEVIETPIPPRPHPNQNIIDCEGTKEYKYTYVDYAGNSATWSYIYTIEKTPLADLLPPVIEETVDCPSMVCCVSAPDPDVYLDDCGNPMIAIEANCSHIQIPCEGTVVYTYEYESCTDEPNYIWTHTFHIVRPSLEELMPEDELTVVDCFVEIPQPVFGPYNQGRPLIGYTYEGSDFEPIDMNVCGNPDPTNSELLLPLNEIPRVYIDGVLWTPTYYNNWGNLFDCEGVIDFVWDYEDCAQSTASWTHGFEVDMPAFTLPSGNFYGSTVACSYLAAVRPPIPGQFNDACGHNLLYHNETNDPGDRPDDPTDPYDDWWTLVPANNGTVEWHIFLNDCTGDEGHITEWIYTYTIFEEDFLMPPDVTEVVECADDIEIPQNPTIFDNCGVELITGVMEETITGDTDCEYDHAFTWSYEDATGYNHNWTYTYEVRKTMFDIPVDETVYVDCPLDVINADLDDYVPDVFDNCENELFYVSVTDPEIPDCGYDDGIGDVGVDVVYEFTYEDCAGNQGVWTLTFNINDNDAPWINPPADVHVQMNNGCFATDFSLGSPEYGDNCIDPDDPNAPWAIIVSVNAQVNYAEGETVLTWTVEDCAGNVNTANQSVFVYRNTLSGNVVYNNSQFAYDNTPLEGIKVTMYPEDIYVMTDADGYYEFTDLCEADRTLTFDEDHDVNFKGGINVTDVAELLQHSTTPFNIEKVKFLAGDVNPTNCNLLSADALAVYAHFLNNGLNNTDFGYYPNFWFAGDEVLSTSTYCLESMDVSVDDNIHQLVYGQADGDYNGSLIPSTSKSAIESLSLVYGEYQVVDKDASIELPLVAGIDMELGAVSLIMNFPADQVEITGAYFSNDPSSEVQYAVSENELRIGWYSLTPVNVNKGESLITLQVKLNDATSDIQFSLAADPLNELANGNFEVIDNAELVIDIPSTSALGFGSAFAENITFSNQPNPFREYTTLIYSIPAAGEVILEVYDILGNKVKVAVDETQSAGDYSQKLDANSLQPGLYTALLKYKTNGKETVVRAIKMIRK